MRFIDLITVSLRNLWRQRMRTLLTVVSIMVGAFLISTMMSVGNGLESFMISQVTTFSSERNISVRADRNIGEAFGFGEGSQEYEEGGDAKFTNPAEAFAENLLTSDDLNDIKNIDGVEEAAFQNIVSVDYIRLTEEDNKKLQITVYGFPDYLKENADYYDVDEDLLEEPNSIVVTGDFAEGWDISNDDVVGKEVFIQATQQSEIPTLESVTKEFKFVIAGVTEKSLISGFGMVSEEAAYEMGAFIKGLTVEEYEDQLEEFEIIVIASSEDVVDDVDKVIEDLGYQSYTHEESLGQIGVVFDVINYVLSGFGGIALFVASIGIINTLLMAIYERTREIGVMMAVGAKRVFVGLMFTIEGALLGFFGGVLGVLSGWGFGRLADNILHNGITIGDNQVLDAFLADYPTFNVSDFTPWLVGFVVITTTMIAWVASIYPAWRAAMLNPIEALRHD